jgi:hypothetical protein
MNGGAVKRNVAYKNHVHNRSSYYVVNIAYPTREPVIFSYRNSVCTDCVLLVVH